MWGMIGSEYEHMYGMFLSGTSTGSESAQDRALTLWKPLLRCAFEHFVFDPILLAELELLGLVAVFVDGVDVGLDPQELRLGVHPAHAAGDQGLLDVADRTGDVAA